MNILDQHIQTDQDFVVCQICKQKFINVLGLSIHLRSHKITMKDYFDKFFKRSTKDGICQNKNCNNKTTFRGLKIGYSNYCSTKCSNNDERTKKKKEKSSLKNYGTTHPMKAEIVKQTFEQTCLERYNVINPSQVEEFKEKKKNTSLLNFGVIHPMKDKKRVKKRWLSKLNKILQCLDLKLLDFEYNDSWFKHNWKCLKCGYEFIQIWNEIQKGYTCPVCNPRKQGGPSKSEKEIQNFIQKLLLNNRIVINSRSVISPKELDIYIPDKQIAIEYNGLYFHSDEHVGFSGPKYHLNKTEECEKQGIQLIHIFEDEWVFKKDIVKSRLKQILNVSNAERIHARKCEIREIDPKTKNEFLEKYHIQGKDSSVIKLGAFYNDKLISVMTFGPGRVALGSKPIENVWELRRFCSDYNYHIPGIAGKLLKHFKRNYEWKEIFSYADRRWSDGNLYYKLKFELDHVTQPNYWYIKNYKRIHRFNLRKKLDEPKDIPEWVLRQNEGYSRIWDCGNLKFILYNGK